MLERRLIMVEGRVLEIKVKGAGLNKRRKPLSAIQVVRSLGMGCLVKPVDTRSLHSTLFRSPNLSAYISTEYLDSITVS